MIKVILQIIKLHQERIFDQGLTKISQTSSIKSVNAFDNLLNPSNNSTTNVSIQVQHILNLKQQYNWTNQQFQSYLKQAVQYLENEKNKPINDDIKESKEPKVMEQNYNPFTSTTFTNNNATTTTQTNNPFDQW